MVVANEVTALEAAGVVGKDDELPRGRGGASDEGAGGRDEGVCGKAELAAGSGDLASKPEANPTVEGSDLKHVPNLFTLSREGQRAFQGIVRWNGTAMMLSRKAVSPLGNGGATERES